LLNVVITQKQSTAIPFSALSSINTLCLLTIFHLHLTANNLQIWIIIVEEPQTPFIQQ
jgi:hypothetical protein